VGVEGVVEKEEEVIYNSIPTSKIQSKQEHVILLKSYLVTSKGF
jgi:hypothetical protein